MRSASTVIFRYLPFRETLLDAVFGELEPDERRFPDAWEWLKYNVTRARQEFDSNKGFRRALYMTESIVLVEDYLLI